MDIEEKDYRFIEQRDSHYKEKVIEKARYYSGLVWAEIDKKQQITLAAKVPLCLILNLTDTARFWRIKNSFKFREGNEMTERVHAYGAKIFHQLSAAGYDALNVDVFCRKLV